MKRRNLKTLALNKCKISELQVAKGGLNRNDTEMTKSGCSCVTCRPNSCENPI